VGVLKSVLEQFPPPNESVRVDVHSKIYPLDNQRKVCDKIPMNVSPRYVTNEAGERTEVILPLASYEELMKDLSDLASIADRRNEPTIPHSDFIEENNATGGK
jgi:hypothetical protein